jgi:hypothetical protein
VQIDLDAQSPTKKTRKTKLTDEVFKSYIEKGMTIAELTKYSKAYLGKMKRRLSLVKR